MITKRKTSPVFASFENFDIQMNETHFSTFSACLLTAQLLSVCCDNMQARQDIEGGFTVSRLLA